jgi:2-oxoglutarate ferredoxin oxidoreductase subunit beta
VHNNGAYALTTGQFSPTSKKGFQGPSRPEGNVEDPLNPLSLLLEAGATFVARGYSAKTDHLADLIVKAVLHEGFSLIDVLQPSVVFNNTYKLFNEITEFIPKPAGSFEEAIRLIKEMKNRMPIGVFYQMNKPVYHKELMGDWNPVHSKITREKRIQIIQRFI